MTSPATRRAMTGWALVIPDAVPYANGVRLQETLHAARLAGRIPDTVVVLQHRPVITLGRRGRDNFLLATPAALALEGIEVHRSSRGGDVTFHGPGQWVLYPILHLGECRADAHGHLWNLEEISIRTCADFGVEAWRRPGKSGAWTSRGKIAAVGFHIKRWVTMHGTSYNVDPQPDGFSRIVPCGLAGEPVASLRTCLGNRCPAMQDVLARLLTHSADVLGRTLVVHRAGASLPDELSRALANCLE